MKRTISDWVKHFESHRAGWTEPDWPNLSACGLDDARKRLLAESLAVFQLGETGGGTRLRRFVKKTVAEEPSMHSNGYERAIDLFLAEENDHARLLARMVGYLGGELRRKYWANGLFRSVRTAMGLEFNLQVLLTAELIAEAYYGLLHRHVPDPVIASVCGRIVSDEVGHIGFHRTFFAWRHRGRLPWATALWSAQLQALYVVAETLVWREHVTCLRAFGVGQKSFQHRARGVVRRFLGGVTAPGVGDFSSEEPHAGLVAGGAAR